MKRLGGPAGNWGAKHSSVDETAGSLTTGCYAPHSIVYDHLSKVLEKKYQMDTRGSLSISCYIQGNTAAPTTFQVVRFLAPDTFSHYCFPLSSNKTLCDILNDCPLFNLWECQKNDIICEFFPNCGLPYQPPFWDPLIKKIKK